MCSLNPAACLSCLPAVVRLGRQVAELQASLANQVEAVSSDLGAIASTRVTQLQDIHNQLEQASTAVQQVPPSRRGALGWLVSVV